MYTFTYIASKLRLRRHIRPRPRRRSISRRPETGNSLLLRIELQSGFTVEGISTTAGNRLLVSSEGEHGKLENTVRKSYVIILEDMGNSQGRE